MRGLWAAVFCAYAAPAVAEAPFLGFPVDCTLGETCFIEDYVDIDPSPSARDYTCGPRTRDGHKGTDIALPAHQAMVRGVAVLAAANGRVEAVRDGVPDIAFSPDRAADIQGRECGNAVRIRHDNGLQTLYCHLKSGSLRVTPGTVVRRGQPLGLIGMSGLTNYPHLHLSVLGPEGDIDPFAPNARTCSSTPPPQLWLDPIPYEATGVITAGFSDGIPEFDDVRMGLARKTTLPASAPLVLFTRFHDAQIGDTLQITITGPGGQILDETETLDRTQKDMMRALGRRAPQSGWTTGPYRGYATLRRNGRLIGVRHADVVVE